MNTKSQVTMQSVKKEVNFSKPLVKEEKIAHKSQEKNHNRDKNNVNLSPQKRIHARKKSTIRGDINVSPDQTLRSMN